MWGAFYFLVVLVAYSDTYRMRGQSKDALSLEAVPGRVRLGTPYAMHLKKCREERYHTRRYFQLIDVLLVHECQIYLTDLYKVHVNGVSLTKKDRERFRTILRQEIEILKPQALITWGRKATVTVEKLKIGRSHYAYPHPAAPWAWRKLMGIPATQENVLRHWQNDLSQQLSF